jgi:hypothetical protein
MDKGKKARTETEAIFGSFVATLDEYVALRELKEDPLKLLSEDTICFFLAASFLQHGVRAHSIEMEVRHPILAPKSETAVDVCVRRPDSPTWIEVKLDKTSLAFNTHFGNLLNDVFRLALIREGTSLMLYVTAKEMLARLESYDRRFLGIEPFCLDGAFLEKLPPDAKKRLNVIVTEKLAGKTAIVMPLAHH